MSSIRLTDTSPQQSFTEVLTLAGVKAFLELPERSPTDAAEDAMLDGFISAARDQAELMQGKDLVVKQWDLYQDCFGGHCIELRHPLVSVDLVQYRDSDGAYTDMVVADDYITDLHQSLILPPYGEAWPSFTAYPTSSILVRFTSGYSASDVFWSETGKSIKLGMLLLISHWFAGRLPFELGASAVQEYPFTVTHLLSTGARFSIG